MKIRQYLVAASCAAAVAALHACGTSNSGASPNPPPTAVPTAVPIPKPAAFTTTTVVAPAPAVAAALVLPTGSVYSGSINLGAPTSLPPGTTISNTLTNVAPSAEDAPARSDTLRQKFAGRSISSANGAIVTLVYIDLLYSNAVIYASEPSFGLTVPANEVRAAADYYVAAYDPSRPSLGWQLGFEGPAKISGTDLSFHGLATPYTFAPNANYYFAVYAISSSAAAPTPAPAVKPIAPTPANRVSLKSGGTINFPLLQGITASLTLPVTATETTATVTVSKSPVGIVPGGQAADGDVGFYAVITPAATMTFTSGTISGTITAPAGQHLPTNAFLSLYDGNPGAGYWLDGPDSPFVGTTVSFSYTLVQPIVINAGTPYIVAGSGDTTGGAARLRRSR